jgi:serine/threonine-protein kinase RsbT
VSDLNTDEAKHLIELANFRLARWIDRRKHEWTISAGIWVALGGARHRARELASELRFSSSELTAIATAISEVARNIVIYSGTEEIVLRIVEQGRRRGLMVFASDRGPGIADIERAMQDGFSTSHGLGIGLPGSKRLMDEFAVFSEVGKGTVVTVTKWER